MTLILKRKEYIKTKENKKVQIPPFSIKPLAYREPTHPKKDKKIASLARDHR